MWIVCYWIRLFIFQHTFQKINKELKFCDFFIITHSFLSPRSLSSLSIEVCSFSQDMIRWYIIITKGKSVYWVLICSKSLTSREIRELLLNPLQRPGWRLHRNTSRRNLVPLHDSTRGVLVMYWMPTQQRATWTWNSCSILVVNNNLIRFGHK